MIKGADIVLHHLGVAKHPHVLLVKPEIKLMWYSIFVKLLRFSLWANDPMSSHYIHAKLFGLK